MINPGQKNFFWSDVHARLYEIKLMYAGVHIIFWKRWCQNCSCRFCRISKSTITCQPEMKFQTGFKKELLPRINFKPEQKKLFFYFITKYNKRLYNIIPIRQVPISNLSAFFPRKVWLLIVVPEGILFQNHDILTSPTWTTSRDVAMTSSYLKNSFLAWKNWINAAIGINSKFRY